MTLRQEAGPIARPVRAAVVVWALLIFSIPFHWRVTVLGREIGISLFDVAITLAWVWWTVAHRAATDRRIAGAVAAVAAIVCGHDLLVRWMGVPLQGGGLLRESVKYVAAATMVGMAASMFRSAALHRPPIVLLAAATAGIAAYVVTTAQLAVGVFAYRSDISGVVANGAVAVLLLAMVAAEIDGRRGAVLLAGMLWVATLAVTLLVYAKSLAAATLAIGLALAFWRGAAHLGIRHRSARLALIGLAGLVALGIVVVAFDAFKLGINYQGTVARSLGVREALWSRAASLIGQHFPIGIGLGQFGAQPDPVKDDFEQVQLFVHNTPLAMVAELGFAGVLLAGATLALVAGALAGLPSLSALAAAIYFAVTFLLNDGLGYRGAILLIGYGLGRGLAGAAGNAISRDR